MSKIVLDTISNTLGSGSINFSQNIYLDLSSIDSVQLPKRSGSKNSDDSVIGEFFWNEIEKVIEWYNQDNRPVKMSIEEDYDLIKKIGDVLYLDTYDKDSYFGSGNFWNNISPHFFVNTNNINGVFFESTENSFFFDATDKTFEVTSSFTSSVMEDGTGSTYTFWFKSDSSLNYGANLENKVLFSVVASDGSGILKIGINPSGNGIYYYDNSLNTNNSIGSINYNDDAWHNLAITRPYGSGGQTSTFYVDGVQIGTLANTDPTYSLGSIVSIGNDHDGTNTINNFGGYLSFVLVHERFLNSSEILNNYDITKYRYGL